MKPTIDQVNQARAEADKLWREYNQLRNTPEIQAAAAVWWEAEKRCDELNKQLFAKDEPVLD